MLSGCQVVALIALSLRCRDVFTVYLTEHADLVGQQPTTTDAEVVERFICPVTQLHSTRYPFVALASCGHVFSDRAVKQVCSIIIIGNLQSQVQGLNPAGVAAAAHTVSCGHSL